jgi:hypothetical protein
MRKPVSERYQHLRTFAFGDGAKLKATSHGRRAVALGFSPRHSEVLYRKQPRVFADVRTFRSSIESASSCAPRTERASL